MVSEPGGKITTIPHEKESLNRALNFPKCPNCGRALTNKSLFKGSDAGPPPGANSDMTTVVLELRTQSQGSPATNTEQPERDRRVSCRRNRTVRTGTAAMPGDSKRLESQQLRKRIWTEPPMVADPAVLQGQ